MMLVQLVSIVDEIHYYAKLVLYQQRPTTMSRTFVDGILQGREVNEKKKLKMRWVISIQV